MVTKILGQQANPLCKLPRDQAALEALLGLAWRKAKKERPDWLIQELSGYD